MIETLLAVYMPALLLLVTTIYFCYRMRTEQINNNHVAMHARHLEQRILDLERELAAYEKKEHPLLVVTMDSEHKPTLTELQKRMRDMGLVPNLMTAEPEVHFLRKRNKLDKVLAIMEENDADND